MPKFPRGEERYRICDFHMMNAMSSGSVEQIKEKTEALQKSAYKLAEEMYKATAASQPQGGPEQPDDKASTASAKKDNGVEDADYEVVD